MARRVMSNRYVSPLKRPQAATTAPMQARPMATWISSDTYAMLLSAHSESSISRFSSPCVAMAAASAGMAPPSSSSSTAERPVAGAGLLSHAMLASAAKHICATRGRGLARSPSPSPPPPPPPPPSSSPSRPSSAATRALWSGTLGGGQARGEPTQVEVWLRKEVAVVMMARAAPEGARCSVTAAPLKER